MFYGLILEGMGKNTTNVRNIKGCLMIALFNAGSRFASKINRNSIDAITFKLYNGIIKKYGEIE